MHYKCTLHKDLPDYPAGTVFFWRQEDNNKVLVWQHGGRETYHHPLREILSHKDWYSQEVDRNSLTAMACEKCGETHVLISLKRAKDRRDGDVEMYFHAIMCECPCGHKYSLGEFNTGYKVVNW
jgi:hypothetical protein